MSLKGELTDLSLAELIEFFCNQRKTGRLTVSYPHTPAYFYLQSGSVVHASIGSLRGIEAVYYALTQSNASFNFSTAYEPPDHTINQPWTSVVLEGLRRMDEGILPRNPLPERGDSAASELPTSTPQPVPIPLVESSSSVIESNPEITALQVESEPVVVSKPVASAPIVEEPKIIQATKSESELKPEAIVKPKDKVAADTFDKSAPRVKESLVSDGFLSSAQHASRFSPGAWKFGVVFAALILIVAGIAVPWGWRARGKAMKAAEQPAQSASESAAQTQAPASTTDAQTASDSDATATQSTDVSTSGGSEAADAAKREREARAREEARLKAKAAESNPSAPTPSAPAQSQPSTTTAQSNAGPKKAVVTVTYDENGRVTQASGSDPTALRIARQKRFPPGKAGSATITIPIN